MAESFIDSDFYLINEHYKKTLVAASHEDTRRGKKESYSLFFNAIFRCTYMAATADSADYSGGPGCSYDKIWYTPGMGILHVDKGVPGQWLNFIFTTPQ
ncbi:hypothetical protein [Pseudenterobacter timonensis]|uniref:hypothetical protein n=1 Tax=Pseudenterobacter timonensis TaxID=1755099 RepID=UPI002877418E|nr:hypothetical protein [Pseudenterobacter timonensis]